MTCVVVAASAAAPKLRNTIVIPLSLPADYQPTSLPAQPLDDELRVGIVPPNFEPTKNATWNSVARLAGSNIWAMTVAEFDRVVLNFAEPIATTLPKVLRRVYPKTEIVPNIACATCDLILAVEVQSRTFDSSRGQKGSVAVTVIIKAIAHDGTTLTTFSAEGVGKMTKSIYWSDNTMAQSIGIPALREAMEHIGTKLTNDATLSAYIKQKASEHARPSELETTVAFDDAGSFFPNGRLDAGEHARLHFTVRNHGAGPAFAVHLHVSTTSGTISVPAETSAGDLAPGEARKIDIPLSATLEAETGSQQLRIETLEKRGYGGRPVLLQLATERLKHPTLEIADVSLDDHGPRTQGDGDGQPSNGETLEAVILVRNSGPGEAVGVTLTIGSAPDIAVVEPLINVGQIPINSVREARTLVRIPTKFQDHELILKLRATETRGDAVATAEKTQQWALATKQPAIEIAYRLYDGNSPQSHGNRDGVANNGETLEIALVPMNRGALAARAVRLTLATTGPGLRPSTIDIGDLPPLGEGTEHRVQLSIPRALGRDDLHTLPLTATITQADFPPHEQVISLPFKAQHSELVAAMASLSPLVEGAAAFFALDIQNQGSLGAEDVTVDVTCDNPAVELLDAAGAPVRTVRLGIGAIAGKTAATRVQLRAQIRRNIVGLAGLLKATITQRDFSPAGAQLPLTIVREEAELISVAPQPPREPARSRGAGIPATVSFQRHRDGSRLADETIGFPFEVQSQTLLETVRLEQNHRAIELPLTVPMRTAGGYLWQFEPQVHLEYGANEFEVVVVTSEGVRNSRSTTLHREKPRGKIWLATIGVSNYQEPSIPNLQFAKEDAVAISAYYRQLGLPKEQIIELLNDNATLSNIKRNLGTELVRNATNPDDMVILYFAGHGDMEADRSSTDSDGYSKYLLLHDTNPADLFGSALSMEELSRILQRLRPERVVLIIDSCFSGAAGGRTPYEPNAASRGVISEEYLSRIANTGKGRVILTASGSREVAQESTETRHGVFTHFLLQGLRGAADLDHDGRIDVDEIYKYVSQKVSAATRGRQNPMRKSPNLTGTLFLGGRLQ